MNCAAPGQLSSAGQGKPSVKRAVRHAMREFPHVLTPYLLENVKRLVKETDYIGRYRDKLESRCWLLLNK